MMCVFGTQAIILLVFVCFAGYSTYLRLSIYCLDISVHNLLIVFSMALFIHFPLLAVCCQLPLQLLCCGRKTSSGDRN